MKTGTEYYYRIWIYSGDIGFSRDMIKQSDKHPYGTTLEKAKKAAGKNGKVYLVTTTIKEI